MRFLNLDLDFFISGIVHTPQSQKKRASKRQHKPWSEAALREFLECRCGLDRKSRLPGRFGIHHDAVFDCWRCLIKTASSGTQLDLVHVDAHGDFAGGIDPGVWVFLMEHVLALPPEQRLYLIDRNRERLTLANYMCFAVACRWVAQIEFVMHPEWVMDISDNLFHDHNPETRLIELNSQEPPVRIKFTPCHEFAGGGFSHGFLSQSPNYTPSTADALIPIFEEYIDFNAA
jgi:hypothetical protein